MLVKTRADLLPRGDSGSVRDELPTIYESVVPHGFLGWGNISTLVFSLAAAIGGKLAFPDRQAVNVTGDAGMDYMLGNLEAPLRHNLRITTIRLNNSGYAGYGPGFWGAGDMPYTCDLTPSEKCNLAKTVEGLGIYAERMTKPAEVAPAIRRALEEHAKNRPAFLEIICSQYSVWGTRAGLIRKVAGGTPRRRARRNGAGAGTGFAELRVGPVGVRDRGDLRYDRSAGAPIETVDVFDLHGGRSDAAERGARG